MFQYSDTKVLAFENLSILCVWKHDELSMGAQISFTHQLNNYPLHSSCNLAIVAGQPVHHTTIDRPSSTGRVLLSIQLPLTPGWTLFNLLISINKRIWLLGQPPTPHLPTYLPPLDEDETRECGSPNFPIGKQICSIAIVFLDIQPTVFPP